MKNFKFRIWDIHKKRFGAVDEYLLDARGNIFLVNYDFSIIKLSPDKVIILGYTGKNDIKGRLIFEGDIVRISKEQMMENNTPIIYRRDYYGVVKIRGASFIIENKENTPMFWKGCEVIGNVFELPIEYSAEEWL